MSLLQGRSFVALCFVAASSLSVAFAKQVNVSTVADLTSATLNAKAGDTIWVAPGKYELPSSNCQNDKFVNETGRDCGLIWLGADGTKANPVVLAGSDPTNPPEIYSSDYKHNYGIHVTGNYVILKNLKIHSFSKGVVFDNSVGALMEDCEVYHTGNEIVHVRDSSQQVKLPSTVKASMSEPTIRGGPLPSRPTGMLAFGGLTPHNIAIAAMTGA